MDKIKAQLVTHAEGLKALHGEAVVLFKEQKTSEAKAVMHQTRAAYEMATAALASIQRAELVALEKAAEQ